MAGTTSKDSSNTKWKTTTSKDFDKKKVEKDTIPPADVFTPSKSKGD